MGLRKARTVTEMRSFSGLCKIFRRLIPKFARIAAPLNRKLRKDEATKFDHLTEEERKNFETLKSKLIEPSLLALTRVKGRYTFDTDACNEQVLCVLLKEQPEGMKEPIWYC